jgi:WD40 repeat protein
VKVWTAATGEIQTLRGHRSWVHSVSFSPNGQRIASASQDGTVKIWELPPLPNE